MGQQNDTEQITADDLEQALSALDQNQPDLIDQAGPAPAQPETKIVRDAFGNRQRVAVGNADSMPEDAPSDLKVQVEMYSLPKDLARLVLSGRMSIDKARAMRQRRARSPQKSTLPAGAKILLAVAAVATGLVLIRLL